MKTLIKQFGNSNEKTPNKNLDTKPPKGFRNLTISVLDQTLDLFVKMDGDYKFSYIVVEKFTTLNDNEMFFMDILKRQKNEKFCLKNDIICEFSYNKSHKGQPDLLIFQNQFDKEPNIFAVLENRLSANHILILVNNKFLNYNGDSDFYVIKINIDFFKTEEETNEERNLLKKFDDIESKNLSLEKISLINSSVLSESVNKANYVLGSGEFNEDINGHTSANSHEHELDEKPNHTQDTMLDGDNDTIDDIQSFKKDNDDFKNAKGLEVETVNIYEKIVHHKQNEIIKLREEISNNLRILLDKEEHKQKLLDAQEKIKKKFKKVKLACTNDKKISLLEQDKLTNKLKTQINFFEDQLIELQNEIHKNAKPKKETYHVECINEFDIIEKVDSDGENNDNNNQGNFICVICLSAKRNCCFIDCGHLLCCFECSLNNDPNYALKTIKLCINGYNVSNGAVVCPLCKRVNKKYRKVFF